ncbi:MAG: YigZ family protein [Phycisphaerae bacterium]
MSRYAIPKHRVRVEIGVSNSRFIATIAPVLTVKEAQAFVREMRAEMPNATHHVYAFRIGYGASVSEGMSDDGEPSGTSGPPTLAVLRGADVGDVVIVTTRYFGGTKLGTGGLVSAYTAAAHAAFEALETEEKVIRIAMECTIPYRILERVRQLLARCECVQVEEQFGPEIALRFLAPEECIDALVGGMHDLTNGTVTPRVVA